MLNKYFDNASTSYPKPEAMKKVLASYYDDIVGSYGRSMDKRTLDYSMKVELLRDEIAILIGTNLSNNIIFTKNATEGANLIINGLELSKKKILISYLEHNAIARPIFDLAKRNNIQIDFFPSKEDGSIDIEGLEQLALFEYQIAIINVESNVNGLIQDIENISKILKKYEIEIMLDASQYLDPYHRLQADKLDIDYIVMTGHKKLLGPSGTGAIFIRNPQRVYPTNLGGNAYKSSEWQNAVFDKMPMRYEYGTLNMLGLNALYESLKNYPKISLEQKTWINFIDELESIGLWVLRAKDKDKQGSIVSIIDKNMSNFRDILYYDFGIICRDSLHCSPLAHKFLGSFPNGALRISASFCYHNENDLNYLLDSIKAIRLK